MSGVINEKMTGFSAPPPLRQMGKLAQGGGDPGLPGQSPPAAFDFTIPT